MQKVKEIHHIYRSGSGASTPSCNHPHYGSTSKRYNPYSRYQDLYGSNRSSNGARLFKFGDTLLERSIENELDQNEVIDSNEVKTEDNVQDLEDSVASELGKIRSKLILYIHKRSQIIVCMMIFLEIILSNCPNITKYKNENNSIYNTKV